jgi:hypothetical protein
MTKHTDLFKQAKEATNRKYEIFDTKRNIKQLMEKLQNMQVLDEAEDLATYTRDFIYELNKKYPVAIDSIMTPFNEMLSYDELNNLPVLISEYMHDMRIQVTDDQITQLKDINDVVLFVSNNVDT